MEPYREKLLLDVSKLPSVSIGHKNVSWLGNIFYMVIEGTMFVLVIASYFYLRSRVGGLAACAASAAGAHLRYR